MLRRFAAPGGKGRTEVFRKDLLLSKLMIPISPGDLKTTVGMFLKSKIKPALEISRREI